MLKLLVAALLLVVAAMLALSRVAPPAEPEAATVLPDGLALPELALLDDRGAPFSEEALEGGFSLMFFGFTNCPDVCPLTLEALASTVERVAAENPDAVPGVVFVSVDPYRDSPERIRAYLDGFDPSFIGATGSEAQLAPLLGALGVSVQKHEHEGEHYNVVHNSTVYFVGPRAEVIAVSSAPHVPATLASDYLAVRAHYLAGTLGRVERALLAR